MTGPAPELAPDVSLVGSAYKSPGIFVRCLGRPRDLVRRPGTVASASWWNTRDAMKRGRWRLRPDGPSIAGNTRPQFQVALELPRRDR